MANYNGAPHLADTIWSAQSQSLRNLEIIVSDDSSSDENRYARALATVTAWCRSNRHQPIPDQRAHLIAMMRGHYAYYGITGNARRLSWYRRQVARIWQKWLSRRGHGNRLHWRRCGLVVLGGPAAARNKALALAHGEWVAIMDSDDFMHPERLTKLVEVARHDNADIVADNLVEFDTNGSKSLCPLLAGRWAR
jgi:glycosyltransferase involved in cell wall biosynthesis